MGPKSQRESGREPESFQGRWPKNSVPPFFGAFVGLGLAYAIIIFKGFLVSGNIRATATSIAIAIAVDQLVSFPSLFPPAFPPLFRHLPSAIVHRCSLFCLVENHKLSREILAVHANDGAEANKIKIIQKLHIFGYYGD